MIRLSLILVALCLALPESWSAVLISRNSQWKYFKGTSEASSPVDAWRANGFNDSTWGQGNSPFFYGESLKGTLLSDMQRNYSSVYFRQTFVINNPALIAELQLEAESDDGFIAWINGVEVARFNMSSGQFPYNGTSRSAIEPETETFTIPIKPGMLVAGNNVLAVHAFNSSLGSSSDFLWNAELSSFVDDVPPTAGLIIPTPSGTLRTLQSVEVLFSEAVNGVDASDLLVNGVPATSLRTFGKDDYVFEFPEPAAGPVQVAFAATHGITDASPTANPFAGGSWSYTLDPTLPLPDIMISEFMADNDKTLNDEDGDNSDWIEIFNPNETTADLTGWFLSNDPANLAKWKFPATSLEPNSYLVVFASEKNRTSAGGKLHTNFKLKKEGDFLALSGPATNIVSSFEPKYPAQIKDVSYGRDRANHTVTGFFPKPTPGSPNTPGGAGFAPEVQFSRRGGTFRSTFQLELSCASTNAVIRYSLGQNLPTENSPIYTAPITINNTIQVRAQAFEQGLLPGNPRSESYILINNSVVSFNSDLPIVVLHNLGAGSPSATSDQFAMMQVFEPKNGVASMTNAPDLVERTRIRKRGSSTEGNPKWNLALEVWNEYDDDKKVEMLDMPAESDWVLYGINSFEPVLIHNPFIYDLSRQVGRYAPRTRFAEVYINSGGGAVSSGNYFGIYVIMEKIKRGADRVDVDKLQPEHLKAPEVTGGYMLKIDRPDPDDSPFGAANQSINYVDPKGPVIRSPGRNAQQQYIVNYLNQFGSALYGVNYRNPVTGYRAYIDVPSWLDHHILNTFAFNVDALRLSTYFYKPREGKLEFGPIWDFDRALGSTDGRDSNPKVWSNSGGTTFFTYTWWDRLFSDPDFWQMWIDRYQELRRNELSTTNINRTIDYFANQVRKAQPREQARWNVFPRNGSYSGEVNLMKTYLLNRVTFMDTQFLARPNPSLPGGKVDGGAVVSLSGPTGAAIYYTLDGTDPRAIGGGISPKALTYSSPITIQNNARLFARSYNPAHRNLTGGSLNPIVSSSWSGPAIETYMIQTPPLAITEIMYNPPGPSSGGYTNQDFEFIELKNIGSQSMNLAGFTFTNGVNFVFGDRTLGAGERVLVVKNRTVFESRYGAGLPVAGEYSGSLDNKGERITLEGPMGEPVASFVYSPLWQPATDGHGFALVLASEAAPFESYGNPESWTFGKLNGTPGGPEPAGDPIPRVLITEILTHTDLPAVDTVELHNPTSSEVDISDWYLSDKLGSPKKYRFPTPTVIAPGGYLTVDESAFNKGSKSFSFGSDGEEVWLFSGNAAGELTGYSHGFAFGAAANGVSFGRVVTSDGRELFPAQRELTLGAPNAGPAYGPVIINEVMYHPFTTDSNVDNSEDEYIELLNVTAMPVSLADPDYPANTWQIQGGAEFEFPAGVTIPAGGIILVVNFDPVLYPGMAAIFRSRFNVPAETPLHGPFKGKLGNSGDLISLKRPDTPEISGPVIEVPYITVDEVDYRPSTPWPANASGTGFSIERIARFANDPLSWRGADATAGRPGSGMTPADSDNDGLPDDWEIAHDLDPFSGEGLSGPDGDPDGDGFGNLQEFIAGTNPRDAGSALSLEATVKGDGSREFKFTAKPERSYTILYRENLETGAWQTLTTIPAEAQERVVTIPDGASATMRFYRIAIPVQ